MSSLDRGAPVEGEFRYRHPIEVRYNDTDALGHVNNAVYFSYFEAARGGYYTAVVGHPFGTGPDADQRTFVIAEARIAYRAPAFYGEPLACAVRVEWISRSAFALAYRVEVEASPIGEARLAADGSTVQVFYDLERGRPMRTPAALVAQLEAYEGRELPRHAPRGRSAAQGQPG
jgi:acyl-CoA thioester hydrolase